MRPEPPSGTYRKGARVAQDDQRRVPLDTAHDAAHGRSGTQVAEGGMTVLWTIAVLLAVLWLVGVVSAYTLSGFIHILLFLAIAIVLIRVIQGRRPIL